jgi:hypothetical protein
LGAYGNTNKAELLMDLIGEIAKTISGNVRETLGADFNLASPIVSRGHLNDFDAPDGWLYSHFLETPTSQLDCCTLVIADLPKYS